MLAAPSLSLGLRKHFLSMPTEIIAPASAIQDLRSSLHDTYATILADPPWRFQNSTGKVAPEHKRLLRYPTMELEEICELPVREFAASKSHLYLWVPNALLAEGLQVMKAWGFTYKASIIWDKQRAPGLGWWLKTRHEFLLIGARNKTPHPKVKYDSIVSIAASEHSAKPEQFAALIEEMYDGPYLELFARGHRAGWEAWGNEV